MTTNTEIIRKDKAERVLGDKGYQVLGNIVIDGPNGKIYIMDNNLNEVVILDSNGITVNIPSSYSTLQEFLNFKKTNIRTGGIGLWRYTTGGVTVSDMIFRSYEYTSNDRDSYVTMAIYASNGTTRKNFYQLLASYRSGVLSNYKWNFGVDAKFVTPSIDTDVDGLGSLKLPQKASDPSVDNARIYYNTATNKVRICEGSTWKDVV